MDKEFQPVGDRRKNNEFKSWKIHHQQVETAKQQELSDSALKEAELKEIRDKAFEEGLQMGKDAARDEIEALKDQLRFWINAFSHPSEQIEKTIKAEIVDCIFWVCKYCLQVEISVHPEKLQNIIEDLLQELPSLRDGKKLFVNEEDLEWIEAQLLPKDKEMILSIANKDASLGRGEFYMRDEQSEVDGKLDTRLQKILQKHLPKNSADVKDAKDIGQSKKP